MKEEVFTSGNKISSLQNCVYFNLSGKNVYFNGNGIPPNKSAVLYLF